MAKYSHACFEHIFSVYLEYVWGAVVIANNLSFDRSGT